MGPNELSLALQCGRRLSWTVNKETYTSTDYSEEREFLKNDPIQKGLLFESLIQFLARGSDDYLGTTDADWEKRYTIITNVLSSLKTAQASLQKSDGERLNMSVKSIERLDNYLFESAAIKDIEQWIANFIDDPLISGLKQGTWMSERSISGIVSTTLGDVQLSGKIDLFCTNLDGSKYLFEIKASNNPSPSHERQLEMYRQMLEDTMDLKKILIRGRTILSSKKYLADGFDSITYSAEQIQRGSPAPVVCQDCRVPCEERILNH